MAQVAVGAGLRVGVLRGRMHFGKKTGFKPGVVLRIVRAAQADLLAVSENDIHFLRHQPLYVCQQVAVEGQLDYELGLDRSSELGIQDLVAVVPKRGGRIDPA